MLLVEKPLDGVAVVTLTGNFLSAAQAYEWGLVNRVVSPEDLMPAGLQLAS